MCEVCLDFIRGIPGVSNEQSDASHKSNVRLVTSDTVVLNILRWTPLGKCNVYFMGERSVDNENEVNVM